MWPPSASPARKLGSKFTWDPTVKPPKVVFAKVSRETSAKKTGPCWCVTVKQAPCTEMLSPIPSRAASSPVASMPNSRSPPRFAMEATVPFDKIIPVNILLLLEVESQAHIIAELPYIAIRECREGCSAELDAQQRLRVLAEHLGRDV